MHTTQRMLLALVVQFYCTTLFAQTSVKIEINGINKPLEENVRLFLTIEQQKEHVLMSEGRLRRLHKKAPKEIASALQPFGYYRPVIETRLTQTTPDHWQASYTIDPGPALPIGQYNFVISEEMRNDPEFQLLIQNPHLRKGAMFSHIEYEKFKDSLAKLASERGYFRARFVEHRIEIDLDVYEARIYLNYNGGPRYRFGEVLLDQDLIDPDLLRRYIPFESGEPYTLDQLLDLQQAFYDSDYFQTVEVSPGEAQLDNDEIPVTVMLAPRKRHRFGFGLGYGTDTGARAKFSWEMPRLNTRGHRFNTDVNVSEIGYGLVAHYRIPVLNPRTDQLIYSAGIVNETTDTSESTLRSIGASLKRSRGEWRETLAINYQQEDFIVADEAGDSILLIPSAVWSRTWGNNFIDTVDGLRFDIGLRGASKKLVSDTDFTQANSGIKFITSLNDRNRFITRGTFGSTWTDEFNQLPASVRFFAGGAQSVRGYAYNSLGPVNEDGQVVGGRHLIVGSIEFEHSFNNKWGIALFYDTGNAIDNIGDDLEKGAGFGFRWKSPVGPVRIDLASALSRDGNPWRIHINIGPDL
jgi:translocation and assembly module TamA